MAKEEKLLDTQFENLSLILIILTVEGENWPLKGCISTTTNNVTSVPIPYTHQKKKKY